MSQTRDSMREFKHLLALQDFEYAAQQRLPKPIFGYIAGAAETNSSYKDNTTAFSELSFIPRALVDISNRTTSASLFGNTYAAPFGIAPMGLSALFGYRGDIALASAAHKADIPFIMSGSSLIPLEEVIKVNSKAWFQAYLPGTASEITALLNRAAQAQFKTLVVTVDTPIAANRENNVRTGFSTPLRPSLRLAWEGVTHPQWLLGTLAKTVLRHGIPHFENNYAHRGAPIISSTVERDFSDRGHLTWSHLEAIRTQWQGTLIVKGILNYHDAATCEKIGADGLIVSNHGGRQLDGAVAPLRVLSDIVSHCPDLPVMLDSGIRRGTDVLKALALGAKFVFVGRPFAYALAIANEAAVLHATDLLKAEISRNMAMLGINDISELSDKNLFRPTAAL